jgi:integrase
VIDVHLAARRAATYQQRPCKIAAKLFSIGQNGIRLDPIRCACKTDRLKHARYVLALARYGGLRCPSELVGLKWSEVNWERSRFTVHSPKTEGQGKSKRTVPIFKELYPFFRERIDENAKIFPIFVPCNLLLHKELRKSQPISFTI